MSTLDVSDSPLVACHIWAMISQGGAEEELRNGNGTNAEIGWRWKVFPQQLPAKMIPPL